MPPPKIVDINIGATKLGMLKPNPAAKMTTRLSSRTSATASMLKKMNLKDVKEAKRKADQLSPPKGKTTKRSALGDLSNAVPSINGTFTQKKTVLKKEIVKTTVSAVPKIPVITRIGKNTFKAKTLNQENIDPFKSLISGQKSKEPEAKKKEPSVKVVKPKETAKAKAPEKEKENVEILKKTEKDAVVSLKEAKKESKTIEVCKSSNVSSARTSLTTDESSLYASALETISESPLPDESLVIITPAKKDRPKVRVCEPPHGVHDFDKENIDDPTQVSHYAMDVFQYLKSREKDYLVGDYMEKQTLINKWMRTLLVDWMVDVQEHFELNHETLYLAVKVMDLYLDRKTVPKESLQLLGAASLYISSKYDERIPPSIEEVLYVCENVYSRRELIRMEMDVFATIDHCLGMPLSYRFLRRFARCCKTSMPVLTLARYILEMSLMEYPFVFASESKIACATLYLALRMKNVGEWSSTLEYYSGYKLLDFKPLAIQLNNMLHKKPKEQVKTVRTKYSHTVFFEVAKIPLIDSETL